MSRNGFAVFMALLLSVPLVGGCGKATDGPSAPTTELPKNAAPVKAPTIQGGKKVYEIKG